MLTACTSPTFSWILYQFLLNKSSHRDQDKMRHLTCHKVIFSITHQNMFPWISCKTWEDKDRKRIIAKSTRFQISMPLFNWVLGNDRGAVLTSHSEWIKRFLSTWLRFKHINVFLCTCRVSYRPDCLTGASLKLNQTCENYWRWFNVPL